jgi:ADP-ribose pyrophosphatase YjhB (NUDIX family)
MVRFCSQCGSASRARVPEGDNRPRAVCDSCGHIDYENPKLVVGCIAEWEDRVVLARRAIEPRLGLWTLPAGFMENGESAEEGAAREAMEEANARIDVVQLYATFSVPQISQVYMIFRARLLDAAISAGAESLEVMLARESEVPWRSIAFPMVRRSLEWYYADRERGHFVSRFETIRRERRSDAER